MPAASADNNSITVANKDTDTSIVADEAIAVVDAKVDTKVDNAKVDSSVDNKAVTNVASKVADKVADSARTSVADSDHRSSSPLSTTPSTPPDKGQEPEEDQPQVEDQVLMQAVPEEVAPVEIAANASKPVAIEPVGTPANALVLSNGVVEGSGIRVEKGITSSNLRAPVAFLPPPSVPVPIVRRNVVAGAPKNERNNVSMNYDNANLEEITMRQLGEDIDAYEHDLSWCRTQLSGDDLTPQETRTLQLRTLDLTHQIRHCKHKIETMQFQSRKPLPGSGMPRLGAFNNHYRAITNREANGHNASANGGDKPHRSSRDETNNHVHLDGANENRPAVATDTNSQTPKDNSLKRSAPVDMSPASPSGSTAHSSKRPRVQVSLDPVHFDDSTNMEDITGPILSMQRLGFWKCQLCLTPTYLLAGNGRSPAQPCKWPLKDISKMITHFTVMHSEQESEARLGELGRALELNRKYLNPLFTATFPLTHSLNTGGPFEYWIRRTRNAKIDDPDAIDDAIDVLKSGRMPVMLRSLSNAASKMQT